MKKEELKQAYQQIEKLEEQRSSKIFQQVKAEELEEAIRWIKKGDKNRTEFWSSDDDVQGGIDYFFEKVTIGSIDTNSENDIIRFCGQESFDKFNGYDDDSEQNKADYASALYYRILEKLKKI